MKNIILLLCFLYTLANTAFAGTLYTCTDLNGNLIITSNPQDGMTKCVSKDFSDDMTLQKKAQLPSQGLQNNRNSDKQQLLDENVNKHKEIQASKKRGAENLDNESSGKSCNTRDCLPASSTRLQSEPYETSNAEPVNNPALSAEDTKRKRTGGYRPPPSDRSEKDASTSSSLR